MDRLEYLGRDEGYKEEFDMAVKELKDISKFKCDAIQMGESTQLIDRMQNFKDNYQIEGPCGITKLLRWSPNTCKSIKDRYDTLNNNNGLKNKYKGSSISRCLSNDYQRWRANNMKEEFKTLENDVLGARAQGLSLDANEELALETWNDFISRLSALNVKALYRNNSIIKLMSHGMRYQTTRLNMPHILFSFDIKDIHLRLLTGSEPTEECVGVVPFGDMTIFWEVDLYWWLNARMAAKLRERPLRYRDYNSNRFQQFSKIHHFVKIQPYLDGIRHPYVQRNNDSYNAGNVCFGHLSTSLYNTFLNLDFELFNTLLQQWSMNYHMSATGPLNNINQSVVGFNSKWPNSMKDRMSVDFQVCKRIYIKNYEKTPTDMIEKHCKECTLIARCDVYDEYLDKESAELRSRARHFWDELEEMFEFGVYSIDFEEDILPAFGKEVVWEDCNIDNWKDSMVEKESLYYSFMFYKYSMPRTMEDASISHPSSNRRNLTQYYNDYRGEWGNMSDTAREEIVAAYKAIYDANQKRSTNG